MLSLEGEAKWVENKRQRLVCKLTFFSFSFKNNWRPKYLMAFPTLQYSKNKVYKAGKILIEDNPSEEDFSWAQKVLVNWRACHGYPINTFQATLRDRLNSIDQRAIVAQRLKRAPSIINKLKRFNTMQLSRMQDIGGLRAIVKSRTQVNKLVKKYIVPGGFSHDLVSVSDYIKNPKPDGYRCIHLVYRY